MAAMLSSLVRLTAAQAHPRGRAALPPTSAAGPTMHSAFARSISCGCLLVEPCRSPTELLVEPPSRMVCKSSRAGRSSPTRRARACVLPRGACAFSFCSTSASVPHLLGTSGPPTVLVAAGPPPPRRVERRAADPAVEHGRPAPAEPFELIHSSYTLRRVGTRSPRGRSGGARAGKD